MNDLECIIEENSGLNAITTQLDIGLKMTFKRNSTETNIKKMLEEKHIDEIHGAQFET